MTRSSAMFYRTFDELPASKKGKVRLADRDSSDGCNYRGDGGGEDGGAMAGDCPLHTGGRPARWRLPARYRVMLLIVWALAVQMALRIVLNVTIIAIEAPAEPTKADGVSGELRQTPAGPTAVSRPALPWAALLPVGADMRWTRPRSDGGDVTPARVQLPPDSETEPGQDRSGGGAGAGGLQLDNLSRCTILSSFYWGYMVSQVPGGRLAERLGARLVLAVSLVVTSLLSLLLPPLTEYGGATAVIIVRLLQGLATGPVLPSQFPLMAAWLPADERQTASALITAAQLLVVAAISPAAASLSVSLGWQSVFYITAGAGFVWLLVWWFCMYDSPAEHPAACACELQRIGAGAAPPPAAAPSPPYCAILRSAPVWAIVVCEVANSWGQQLLVTLVPLYLTDAVGLDLRATGLLSGVPHIGRALLGLLLGLNGDLALRRGWLATLTLRRLATVASCGGVSVCLLALPLVAHLPTVTGALFCLAGLTTAFTVIGHPLSTIDVSPTFCGTVFGLVNTAGGVASLLCPMVAGAILDGSKGAAMLAGWRLIFWLAAGVNVLGLVGFLVMASAERQHWDVNVDSKQKKVVLVKGDDQAN